MKLTKGTSLFTLYFGMVLVWAGVWLAFEAAVRGEGFIVGAGAVAVVLGLLLVALGSCGIVVVAMDEVEKEAAR